MNIAYVRVSTVEQNEERQIKALEKYNIDKWFIEKVSGKDMKRQQLMNMLEFAREGDNIYVHDLSRLARSTTDLLQIVDLVSKKKINLISNKENIDTNTPTGKLMLTMVGAINEFERQNLKERQAEGILIAKQKGKYKGRKKIERPENWNEVYSKWINREITSKKAMQELNLKSNVFYNFIIEEKELKKVS